jgi:hypothetical protein
MKNYDREWFWIKILFFVFIFPINILNVVVQILIALGVLL